MFHRKRTITIICLIFMLAGVSLAEDVKESWGDFLHYASVGRLDLAEGYGQKLLDSDPDPEQLLELSEGNLQGYNIILKMHADSDQLRDVSGQIIDLIEQGRFIRRTDPKVIVAEIKRLSGTIRGRIAAERNLKNSGEYAIPYMLDVLADKNRKREYSNIISAIPKIGRPAIRPLVTALKTNNVAVKAEIIRALGVIGYSESAAYLQYVIENSESTQLVNLAKLSIKRINASLLKLPADELFFMLGEMYYYHNESLMPSAEYDFANVWFWDANAKKLTKQEVSKEYFNELMSMRACEWALKSNENIGKAIALWIAAFFKSESYGVAQPDYFGATHADAITYATTAGPEYLHQALERALRENNEDVALGVVEALAANAGEQSLLYRVGVDQPLAKALSFEDRPVRYSAAIAIGGANPTTEFLGDTFIVRNLAEAIDVDNGMEELGDELARLYAIRAVNIALDLAIGDNKIVDLSKAMDALVKATATDWPEMQLTAAMVLARLESPDAQKAIAQMALSNDNSLEIRIAAFKTLAVSAKFNANQLTEEQVNGIYDIVSSQSVDAELRTAASGAYGALNLPSKKVKNLILDQAKD